MHVMLTLRHQFTHEVTLVARQRKEIVSFLLAFFCIREKNSVPVAAHEYGTDIPSYSTA
jgi:hypothetical protein